MGLENITFEFKNEEISIVNQMKTAIRGVISSDILLCKHGSLEMNWPCQEFDPRKGSGPKYA